MSITYPGVYVQEIAGQPQAIGGVTTSLTAFLGRAPMGPVATPTLCNSLADVHSLFGPDWTGLPMGQSLADFFVNGGNAALVIRLMAAGGQDNPSLSAQDLIDGLSALGQPGSFNLLVIPPDQLGQDIPAAVWQSAAAACQAHRAFLLVDPPSAWTSASVAADQQTATPLMSPGLGRNAAVYFPNLLHGTPFPPSGAVAGIYAATDLARGVWKAPAGIEAVLNGIDGLALPLTDTDSGLLNPVGINALRSFPVYGPVIWGARTLAGANVLADDYQYVPVRRLALYIESSVYAGCQWAVFEPNAEALWSALRLAISTFLQNLMLQGAFYSFNVACDATTTTQTDIDQGLVNILISIAPVKPAEFLVIQIQLTAAAPA